MKTYNHFHELPEELKEEVDKWYGDDVEGRSYNFFDYFGGHIYLVETELDLKMVPTSVEADIYEGSLGGFKNITETPSQYDVAIITDDGKFVLLVLITTNAGGDSYLIPIEVAKNCPNVMESLDDNS